MNEAILTFDTLIGHLTLRAKDQKVFKIEMDSPLPLLDSNETILQKAKKQLMEYFGSKRKKLDFPIHYQTSDFYMRVYEKMLLIPYGETVSYQQLAILAGSPKACRAVGSANNRNPLPPLIPCHRVIGKDGSMVGFGSGIWRKELLLSLEKGKEYHQWIADNREKIYSFGLSTPKTEEYNLQQGEEVTILLGQAQLQVEDTIIDLKKGDKYLIPAGKKHRVNYTSWDCIWDCLYLR